MPELAEVENVRRYLNKNILNKKIVNIESNYQTMVNGSFDEFKNKLLNNSFIDVKRRGKYLIFELDDLYLLSHLRMEGKFFYKDKYETNKHIHMIFTFCDGTYLMYQDTRKFGRMELKTSDTLNQTHPFLTLAKDANDPHFKKEELYDKLKKSKKPIKTALLDQEIIAGLGNIYVDEVLFLSHLNPYKISNELSLDDCQNILKNSKIVLDKAIIYGGTTIHSFAVADKEGKNQNNLLVHTKKICPTCNSLLYIEKIGGRSTYYCKNCQR